MERYNPCSECKGNGMCKICDYHETMKELLSLTKKVTPMEVHERTVLKDMHGHPYTIRGNCPVCGSAGLLASNTDYCNACGQKLKWDGQLN